MKRRDLIAEIAAEAKRQNLRRCQDALGAGWWKA